MSAERYHLAEKLLTKFDGLPGIARASITELTSLKGIGRVKAIEIKAALELGRRLAVTTPEERPTITSPADAANIVHNPGQNDPQLRRMPITDYSGRTKPIVNVALTKLLQTLNCHSLTALLPFCLIKSKKEWCRPVNQLQVDLPLYVQIAEGLFERIESAELVPGDRLPSERKLSQQLGVTRTTLRQALSVLEQHGLLKRMQGVGTYVASLKIDRHAAHLVPFTKGIKHNGFHPGANVVMMRQEAASLSVARRLRLTPSAHVYYSHRIRLVNHEPTMLEKYYLPVHIFPGFHHYDLNSRSVYEVIETEYGITITHADLNLEAVSATEYEAELLGVPKGAPLILEERIGYDVNGRPIEYAKDLYRGDRFRFVTRHANRLEPKITV